MAENEVQDDDEAAHAAAAVVGITPQQAARLVEGITGLTSKVTDLHASVEADRRERVDENELRDKRIAWSRKMVGAALAVAALAVLVALIGVGVALYSANRAREAEDSAAKAQSAVDKANDDLDVRLRNSCIQANVATSGTRMAMVGAATKAIIPPGVELTPEQQQRGADFVARYSAEVEALLPYRNCSDAGIAEFLSHPPEDPNATTTTQPGG